MRFGWLCTEMADRNVLQRETFYFVPRVFQSLYFITFTSYLVLLLWCNSTFTRVYFYTSICTFTSVKTVCTFSSPASIQSALQDFSLSFLYKDTSTCGQEEVIRLPVMWPSPPLSLSLYYSMYPSERGIPPLCLLLWFLSLPAFKVLCVFQRVFSRHTEEFML